MKMYKSLVHDWYEAYKVGIYRYALSILGDVHLAEDVLQETFLRLLTGKYSVEIGKERAWLYRVARNLCFDILRRRKREQEEQTGEAYAESGLEFCDMIAPLSQRDREIVSLKIIGGLTHREIARVVGMTERGVQKRYERALHTLREEEQNGT